MPITRIAAAALVLSLAALAARADNWPAWRGPTGQGITNETNLPLKWSSNDNVKWKVPLPDAGNSTPIVWGDRIFLTQAAEKGKKRSLLCLARADGAKVWEMTVSYDEDEPKHETNTYCAASPVTDGERVVVSYGSAGLYCYDMAGKELWHRDLGKCHHSWGNASSPVIYRDLVYLNFGPNEKAFLIALDKRTGKDVWKAEAAGRPPAEFFGAWDTPVVAEIAGRTELVMTWPGVVKGYDPLTGEVLWSCRGLEKDAAKDRLAYASPLVSPEAIVAQAGYGGPTIALKPGGRGDITDSNRLWRVTKNPQRIGSGVIVGDYVFVVNESGPACLELKTGKERWSENLSGGVWGSIVRSGDRLYLVSQRGETVVFAAKPEFEVISRNPLNETTRASLAPSGGEIFIRTYKHLWCIAEKK